MADEVARRDDNRVPVLCGIDDTTGEIRELRCDADGNLLCSIASSGGGDVNGPASSTDNAIALFDGTGGKTLQNSTVIIDPLAGDMSGVGDITGVAGGIAISTATNGDITIDPGGSGTTTVNAGSGGVVISTDAGNSNIVLSPHGTGTIDVRGDITFDADASYDIGTAAVGTGDIHIGSTSGVVFNNNITIARDAGGTARLLFTGSAGGYRFDDQLEPTTNDGAAIGSASLAWSDLFLASGAVINFNGGDVLIRHSTNRLYFEDAGEYSFDQVVVPDADDGAALGKAATAWSDLFLASGAIIGFDNGDVTITHSANKLDIDGGVVDFGSTPTVNGEGLVYNQQALSTATVATDDKVVIQDTSDSDNFKTVTAQAIADLAAGGGDLNSTVATWQQVPNAGGFYNLADTNSFTHATDGSIADERTGIIRLGTGSSSGTGSTITQDSDVVYITNPWDCDQFFSAVVWVKETTSQDAFWGVGNSAATATNVAANATLTAQHIGFFVADGTIYASNANGTTQTSTDVSSGITLAAYNTYEWTLTGDTSIVFKINGTTVATHTTNIPTTSYTNYGLAFGIETQTADFRSMQFGRGVYHAIDLTNATGQ